jgi:hypothetical protein
MILNRNKFANFYFYENENESHEKSFDMGSNYENNSLGEHNDVTPVDDFERADLS